MPIDQISKIQEIIDSRNLESIIETREFLKANATAIQQKPAESYSPRKNLGSLLTYNDQFYLNPSTDAMMHEDVKRTAKKLDGSVIAIVKDDGVDKYLPEIKTENLYPIALNMTEEYRELSAIANNPQKRFSFILKHVSNPDIYQDCLAINPNAEQVLERAYGIIANIKTDKINKKYEFTSINDEGKEDFDRGNIADYISENVKEAKDDVKTETYMNVANAWYASKKNK